MARCSCKAYDFCDGAKKMQTTFDIVRVFIIGLLEQREADYFFMRALVGELRSAQMELFRG